VQNRLTATDQSWCDDLVLALRLRDVPGARIGEVLAEVQSHLAETGEDPRQAFGTPKDYARDVAGAVGVSPSPRLGSRGDVVHTVVLGLGGFLLADGLWSLGAGDTAAFGLPAWVVVAVSTLLLVGTALRVASATRRDADRVIDPRTGADMVPFAPWRVALLVAVPVLALAAMLVGGLLSR
jgi:hypothetical protein